MFGKILCSCFPQTKKKPAGLLQYEAPVSFQPDSVFSQSTGSSTFSESGVSLRHRPPYDIPSFAAKHAGRKAR